MEEMIMTSHVRKVYERLIKVARAQETIFYEGVAGLIGLDMENPADRNKLGQILGEISTYEVKEKGRPMLSALVVHKGDDYMPGSGFFNLARELERYTGPDYAFFCRELRAVHEAWK